MARPNKTGLDYFPLDVVLDEKIELIEAKYGLLGFGIIVKLFQNIYKNGYFIDVSEDRLLLLKNKLNVDYDLIEKVIGDGCKWNIFDYDIFKKYQVLTSRGIQKRFIEATKRRKEVDFIREYLVMNNVSSWYKDEVVVNINKLNDNINDEIVDHGTYSKEE